MSDYEFLSPRGRNASGRSGPTKPPRLHSAGDLTSDLTSDLAPPHISVTAPVSSTSDGEGGSDSSVRDMMWPPPPPPPQQDKVDRLKVAGSFDSLDSETLVSVGSLSDLDTLLADLQNSIGQPSRDFSPTQQRKTSPAVALKPSHTASPSQYSEVRTETKRCYQRESPPPPPDVSSGGGMQELDTLLHDLGKARYAGDVSATHGDSPSPQPGKMVAVTRTPPLATLDDMDIVPSPNAKTYETRTVTVTESVPEGCQVTSSATQELDDLMASLSDFTIHATSYQKTVVEEEHDAPSRAEPLDTMLDSLQEDLSRHGVDTAPKGTCAACGKPIVGQIITALGQTWHAEHFTCAHCQHELGSASFFERDGRPYCERDYHELFSPRCAACHGPILDKCVTALEKTWHPDHFVCAECTQPFGEAGFHERDGRAYCRADYFRLFAPRCGGCCQPVMENYISALNSQWHAECFVCKDCQRTFENGSFFEYEGHPYCETHYHAKRGSLCGACHKPIKGRCVTAMFKKFHPEHFVCSFCLKQLNKGTFKEQADKPYCHQCFDKLFG